MRAIVHRTVDSTALDFWELTMTPRGNSGVSSSSSPYRPMRLVHFQHIAREYGLDPPTRKMGPKAAIAYFNELLSDAKKAA